MWFQRTGVILLGAKLALIPVLFDPLGEDVFGVIKSAGSRAILYLLLATVAGYLVMSRDARKRLARPRGVLAAIAGVSVVAMLATAFAVHRETALYGAHHRYLGLTSIVDGVVLAVAMPLFVSSRRDLGLVITSFFVGAVVVVGYAVLQLAQLDPIAWQEPQLASTLGNRGVLAGYLVIVATTASVVALVAWRWIGVPARIAVGVLALCSTGLVAISGARGPALALPLALLVAAVTFGRGRQAGLLVGRLNARRLAAAAVVGAGGVAAFAAPVLPKIATFFTGSDTSLAERMLVYTTSLTTFMSRPVLGAGPDHFAVLYSTMRPVAPPGVVAILAPGQTSAHSWPLHNAIGLGLLGLVALGLLVVQCGRRTWTQAGDPDVQPAHIGGGILFAFLMQGAFNIPSVGTEFLFWAGIGLCAAGPLSATPSGTTVRRRIGRGSIIPLVVATAIGVALASTTMNWVIANREVRASDALRSAGRLDLAERAALIAIQRDPGRANNWNVLGLARSPRDPKSALVAFERAAAIAPFESRYVINIVKDEARVAESDASFRTRMLSHGRRAVEIDPRNPETHMVLSYALLQNGDAVTARSEAELAIRLAPRDPTLYAWSAAVHEDTSDFATAAARYQQYSDMTTAGAQTPDVRARLARLYVRAGNREAARSLATPRVIAINRDCNPACRLINIAFDAPLGIADRGVGSALDPAKYMLNGAPLHPEAELRLQNDGRLLVIQLPVFTLVTDGSVLSIAGVTDAVGFAIEPDPTVTNVR